MEIFSYVIARDYGFAPNPFFGVCTLATCKPDIRKSAQVGDIIIGTRAAPYSRQIVFYMKVSEILSFQEYWDDHRFASKKPNLYGSQKSAFGDNIYHKNGDEWLQEDSHHTHQNGDLSEENLRTDTKSTNVLIASEFSYLGVNSVCIPDDILEIIKKGPGFKRHFSGDFKSSVTRWLTQLPKGYLGMPIDW